jgi:hypothetical protein
MLSFKEVVFSFGGEEFLALMLAVCWTGGLLRLSVDLQLLPPPHEVHLMAELGLYLLQHWCLVVDLLLMASTKSSSRKLDRIWMLVALGLEALTSPSSSCPSSLISLWNARGLSMF